MVEQMTTHGRADLDRLSALARRLFSHALMSDTKWRRLFTVLDEADVEVRRTIVKFIDVEVPKPMALPRRAWLHPPHPFIDTPEFGPIELRAIEWLDMPAVARLPRGRNLPDREIPQDIDGAAAVLTAHGRFPLERGADGLRVVGYQR